MLITKDIGFLSSITADRSSSRNHSHLKKIRRTAALRTDTEELCC